MNSCPYTVAKIARAMVRKGYKWFENEYDLNLVGVRTDDDTANTFNDWLTVSHKRDSGVWAFYAFQATTDPGLYWRENPINVEGTAILVPDQYRGMWRLGKHRGKYDALVQNNDVTVFRDNDGDTVLDTDGPTQTGQFGINCHRANASQDSRNVDKWSAGCQVLADPDDFAFLLTLCNRQVDKLNYRTFSYTLLEEVDFR